MKFKTWLTGFVGGGAIGWGFCSLIFPVEKGNIYLIGTSLFCIGAGIFAGNTSWMLSRKEKK